MTLSLSMVTVDSADPRPLAQWWAGRLGGRVVDESDGWFVELLPPEGVARPRLAFQRVMVPTPGKNRMHLDLDSSDRATDVAELLAAGATHVAEHTAPGYAWTVLADPQGNQFCVGAPEPSATELT